MVMLCSNDAENRGLKMWHQVCWARILDQYTRIIFDDCHKGFSMRVEVFSHENVACGLLIYDTITRLHYIMPKPR